MVNMVKAMISEFLAEFLAGFEICNSSDAAVIQSIAFSDRNCLFCHPEDIGNDIHTPRDFSWISLIDSQRIHPKGTVTNQRGEIVCDEFCFLLRCFHLVRYAIDGSPGPLAPNVREGDVIGRFNWRLEKLQCRILEARKLDHRETGRAL